MDLSRDALANEASSYVAQGFKAVKMRAGIADEDEDVAHVREATGPACKLMVDANQACDIKQTLRMARKLEEFDLFWLTGTTITIDGGASAWQDTHHAASDPVSFLMST